MGDGDRSTPDPDHAWKALSLVNEWIRHADAKVGVTLAASGVAAVSLYNVSKDVTCPSGGFVALAVLCTGLLVATAVCGAIALVPRVKLDGRKEPESYTNLLFYKHIGRGYDGKAVAYVNALAELTRSDQELTKHIAEQVHANATVADRKYKWTNIAVRCLAAAIICLALSAAVAVWS